MKKGSKVELGSESIIILPTLVEITNSSLALVLRNLPRRSSAIPYPYIGAVSKYRIPFSQADSRVSNAFSSSNLFGQPPMGAVPIPNSLMDKFVLPIKFFSLL